MGVHIEGPSFHQVASLRIERAVGNAGTRWLELFAVGHDGKEVSVGTMFDTHEVVIEDKPSRAFRANPPAASPDAAV